MGVINPAIFIILERFPESRGKITKLFASSPDFQVLCDDLRQCREALQYWNRSGKPDALARRQEYQELHQELENEIIRFLNDTE